MKKVHLVGAGGIGLSAIGRMLLSDGWLVSGSDQSASPVTKELEKLGAAITIGPHQSENLPRGVMLVVYSLAVPIDNPELVAARERGIEILSYPQMLGRLSRENRTIAVAGTHGKTTTTAMLAEIMVAGGLDPTVIVGSFLFDSVGRRTNFIAGRGAYLLVEACEFQRSFLNLSPEILVITNIDNDHLDCYRDLQDLKNTFAELAAKARVVITATEYQKTPINFPLLVPGEYNVRNAQAAAAAARVLGVGEETIVAALSKFRGTWRRFERVGELPNGAWLYDDYAHHPTALRAVFKAAREFAPARRLVVAFQPHLYSRTQILFDDFVEALMEPDVLLLAPIYAAREASVPDVSSERLAKILAEHRRIVHYVPDLSAVEDKLRQIIEPNDLVLTVGAGDIYQAGYRLVGRLY